MFGLYSILVGVGDGLVLFLSAMGFGKSIDVVSVVRNTGGTTIVGRNLDEIRFRGGCIILFCPYFDLKQLFVRKLVWK